MNNIEASALIEVAFEQALKLVFEDHRVGDLLQSWVIIGHVANIDSDEGDGYPMMFSNGRVPTHVARGLLHTGMKMLNDETE